MLPINHLSSFMASEIEIVYRNRMPFHERVNISSSEEAHKVIRNMWDDNKIELLEQFKILLMDRNSNCLGISEVSSGGISSCIVDPRMIFAIALKAEASGIILARNHPSGNLKASEPDLLITKKLAAGGKLLDIAIMDHLIITTQGYYSFSDNGMMPHPLGNE